MSQFKEIDRKLTELTTKLNAKLTKDRPDSLKALITFEERRIDWIDNGIHKAIIIQPTFENTGVNSTIWNFINLAWIEDYTKEAFPYWEKQLLSKKHFKIIEQEIDRLLMESEENLSRISLNDLK